jgi:hypothetical protein
LATQPSWPFEYTLGGIALSPDDAEGNGTEPTDNPVVWIAGRLPSRNRPQRPGVIPMACPPSGLTARAVVAAHRARDTDPAGFPERHQDWHTWQRRARLARTLANMLGVPGNRSA